MGKGGTARTGVHRGSVVSLVLLPGEKPSPALLGDWEVPRNLPFRVALHHLAHMSLNFFFFFLTSAIVTCNEGPEKQNALIDLL